MIPEETNPVLEQAAPVATTAPIPDQTTVAAEAEPPTSSALEGQAAPAEPAQLDPASIDRITTVMIQTGASKSGTEQMLAKMTDEEKAMLAASITDTADGLRITDSASYFAVFESYNDRVHKASASQS
jgi:hypothetical protein